MLLNGVGQPQARVCHCFVTFPIYSRAHAKAHRPAVSTGSCVDISRGSSRRSSVRLHRRRTLWDFTTGLRGVRNVDAQVVNAALVSQISRLPEAVFPGDGGDGANRLVGTFDFVAIGGDIANRAEVTNSGEAIQSAAVSWQQFRSSYIDGVELHTRSGSRSRSEEHTSEL